MIDQLPIEIIDNILIKYQRSNDPLVFYHLRYINKFFFNYIYNFKDIYQFNDIKINNKLNHKLNEICCKRTSYDTYRWLMNNNVCFTLKHIKNLIIHNREDIIRLCLQYPLIKGIIFNRFYLYSQIENSDIPLNVAGKYNRITILKLLLENESNKIQKSHIQFLFDLSFQYNHKQLLKFLIMNYYSYIRNELQDKFNLINHNLNIEDLYFYLILTNKIEINHNLLVISIIKGYHDLFIYCYNKTKEKNMKQLLIQCIQKNNQKIFDYLLSDKSFILSNYEFTKIIMNMNCEKMIPNKKKLLIHLLNNYQHKIDEKSNLIQLCILNHINNNDIHKLILKGYEYSYDELEITLKNKNIELLEILCNHFKMGRIETYCSTY